MKELVKFSWQPELKSPSLVVGWSVDAGKLGEKVTGYLNQKLTHRSFAEIEPAEFFPLGGVAIENDLLQFPESRFYSRPGGDLVIFRSPPPGYEWYKFLDLILDTAQHYCHGKELYTIGSIISPGAHTTPRELIGVFNSPELKEAFSRYDLDRELNYETPSGHRPTLNSFLLWAARRRNIPGVSLWVPIPFYLVTVDDARAQRRVLEFFNQRFDLRIDLSDLDEEARLQNEKISRLRGSSPEIDRYITRLESNLRLSEEENEKLVLGIEECLQGNQQT